MMGSLEDEADNFQSAIATIDQLTSEVEVLKAGGVATVRQQLLTDLAHLREQVEAAQAHLQSTEVTLTEELASASAERDVLLQQVAALRQLAALDSRNRGDAELQELVVRLQEQIAVSEEEKLQLQLELDELRLWRSTDDSGEEELRRRLVSSELELSRLKEAYVAMRADKRRLKAEKADLHQQMKMLYATLEEKEQELKALVDSYDARIDESESNLRRLSEDKEGAEREKCDNLRIARESAERSAILKMQLDVKEEALKVLEEELCRVRRQSRTGQSNGNVDRGSPNTCTPHRKLQPVNSLSDSFNADDSSMPSYSGRWSDQGSADIQCPPITPGAGSRPAGRKSSVDEHGKKRKKKQRKGLGSLSKVFLRSGRSRTGTEGDEVSHSSSDRISHDEPISSQTHGLTDEELQDRWRVLEEAKGQDISQWKAGVVVAWLEVKVGMPQYAKSCQLNIKSGRVLLGMSDTEIESSVGMSNVMHRRKLLLAIEYERSPELCKWPMVRDLDHIWVSTVWMHEIGLSQHRETMLANMVDGSVLGSLTRKEMDRHLGITRKFHQASLLYSVELLRRVQFNRQVLAERRAMCEEADTDPLVWTNQRFVRWVHSIDLGEYADNLQESGVHGAIVVLEPSFGGEVMGTALGIPTSRTMIRRHLTDELHRLVAPAKAALKICNSNADKSKKLSNSVGRNFLRGRNSSDCGRALPRRRRSFRDSLGKAFGHRPSKQDYEYTSSVDSGVGADATPSVSVINTIGMDLESTTV